MGHKFIKYWRAFKFFYVSKRGSGNKNFLVLTFELPKGFPMEAATHLLYSSDLDIQGLQWGETTLPFSGASIIGDRGF